MPKINANTLPTILKDAVKFSAELKKISDELSKMSPLDLEPIMKQFLTILSIQSRNITQAILAIRLIKQTLLLGHHCFYMSVCQHILPTLFWYLREEVLDCSSNHYHEKLIKIWESTDLITQSEIKLLNSFQQIIRELFNWFSKTVPEHPHTVGARFSSHFEIMRKINGLSSETKYTFFRDEEKEIFNKNCKQGQEEGSSGFENLEKWKKYCLGLCNQFVSIKSEKDRLALKQVISTGDSHAILETISSLQEWIASYSKPELEQLKVCRELIQTGEIEFNELIQIQIMPYFINRIFNSQVTSLKNNKIVLEMLRVINQMREIAMNKDMNFQVYERILKKMKFSQPASAQAQETESGLTTVLQVIKKDKKKQLKSLYGSQKEQVIDKIVFAEEEKVEQFIRSSQKLIISEQCEDRRYHEEGVPSVEDRYGKMISIGSNRMTSSDLRSKKNFYQSKYPNEKKKESKIEQFSNIPSAMSEFGKKRRSQIRSSERDSQLMKKSSDIKMRRSKHRLHSGSDQSDDSKIVQQKQGQLKKEYFQSVEQEYFPKSKRNQVSSKEYILSEKAWKRMQSKPQKRKIEKHPENQIFIQQTIKKPKFSFKSSQLSAEEETQDFFQSQSSLSKTSEVSSIGHEPSHSKSNFGQVLQFDKNNLRVVRSGDVEGYFMSKVDNKEEQLGKKLKEIKRKNEQFDQLLREKDRDIEAIKKKLQRQEDQAETYKNTLAKAYDNAYECPDSLLVSSRNYEQTDEAMETRIRNKVKVKSEIKGIAKKFFKQILYGKSLIFDNQYLQIGFDNKKPGQQFCLYFIFKDQVEKFECSLQNIEQSGYMLMEDFDIKIHKIPAGKKIKSVIKLDYLGSLSDSIQFMSLDLRIHLTPTFTLSESIMLPYCLYRNYFKPVKIEAETQKQKKNKKNKKSQNLLINHPVFKYVTEWENCCQDLAKNNKEFLDILLSPGQWIEEGVYEVALLFKQFEIKKIRILMNNRNFAIEMENNSLMEIVNTIGCLLARY